MVQSDRTIDFLELRAIDGVIRHGGITAAARKLGLSKSTVSMQVTRLEERLGVRLLERNSRRIALTREGAQLLPRIRSILAETEHLLDDTLRSRAAPSGTVRMAVTPPLGGALLEHLLPALAERYPDIALVAVPGYELDDMQDPGFDFAVRVGHVRDDTLVARRLGHFRRVLVCGSDHPTPATGIDDLAAMPLLGFSPTSADVDWRLCRVDGSAEDVAVNLAAKTSVRDFDVLLRLARAGHGVAMVPDFMVASDLAEQRLVHVLPEWQSPPLDVMLAYRAGASRIARVAAVLEETRLAVEAVLTHHR